MMRKVFLCTAAGLLGLALACSKSTTSPASPTSATQPDAGAAADGSTLKAGTPSAVSPTGGTQLADALVLTASKVTGKNDPNIPLSYQFQVRSGPTVVYDSGVTGGVGSGSNVTHTPSVQLEPETNYTWRVRSAYQGAVGSWSADASFRSAVGAYITGSEIRDPLTIGKTVGTIVGPVQFSARGIELLTHESHVRYQLPVRLEAGEFSMMVTGIGAGSAGDKSKVMSMQEGTDDITVNRYRFTAEKRGRNHIEPNAVTFRIITGDPAHENGKVNDGNRVAVGITSGKWYLWKITWGGNVASLEVRADSPTGPRVYFSQVTMGGTPYRPNPHMAYLGQPPGRGGIIDATIPGMAIKNVWLSSRPRPTFPDEQ